jgi:F-type H+-transporting ATPase subunit gamma
MESLQQLQSRLRAVKNIGQITKAMEVVAAVKMRTAQEAALRTRPYAFEALRLLENLAEGVSVTHPLMEARTPVRTTLIILVSSDKGLAGSFNANVFRTFERFLKADAARHGEGHGYRVIAVGKKAREYTLKKHIPLEAGFVGFGDFARSEEVEPVSTLAIKGFENGKWDRAVTISIHFRTALKQEPLVREVLPVRIEYIKETVRAIVPEHGRFAHIRTPAVSPHVGVDDYIYEPSREAVYETLIPFLVAMQVYHLVLEANASEHSARRVAMKTATDNAHEITDELTLTFNKVRQANITNEIIEITSTQSALN